MPNEREFVKKQLVEVKENILVIARAENARKSRQKKKQNKKTKNEKLGAISKKNRLNSPRNISRERKTGSLIYRKRT